jgi:hypothetical protein
LIISKLNFLFALFVGSERSTQMLRDWGLKLSNDTVELSGRVVDSEKIFFGQTSECVANQNADWTGQLTRSRVFQAVSVHQLLCN